jgi:hypothetical protein
LGSTSHAVIEGKKDLGIAGAMLSKFARRCTSVSNQDYYALVQVRKNLKEIEKLGDGESDKCVRSELTQIEAVQILFSKICSEVSEQSKGIRGEALESLLVNSERYKNGIRPFLQRMNDCLAVTKKGSSYIVDVSSAKLENRILLDRLDRMSTRRPFRANRLDFR